VRVSSCPSPLSVFIRNPNYKGINPLITPKDKKHKKTKDLKKQRLLRKKKTNSLQRRIKAKEIEKTKPNSAGGIHPSDVALSLFIKP